MPTIFLEIYYIRSRLRDMDPNITNLVCLADNDGDDREFFAGACSHVDGTLRCKTFSGERTLLTSGENRRSNTGKYYNPYRPDDDSALHQLG